MAINIEFDLAGNPETPTIILATRNGNRLGRLDVDAESIDICDRLNDASEFSFTLSKYVDDKITNLWDKVVNFKLVYCEEWDMYFEITVELDEETETIKTVFCTQLGQAELSKINLYDIHINEKGDANWDKDNEVYKSTILYDENNHDTSLLHRLLKDKAPHYSIIHVDDTIKNEQRTFSFDDISIYDSFQKIEEEIGCLFDFPSNSDENGKIQRTIAVYDLQQNCKDCGYRGEFTDTCPKCGSNNISNGYGEDTLIFVTSDELASSGIQLTSNTDSVYNCFKLEAGDDLMTATIRNCNPNGTDYIWRFSNDMKSDMSNELVEKIESYDEVYKNYQNNHLIDIDADEYNNIINKYIKYNDSLKTISSPIKGYSNLMNVYYDVVDLSLYLESALMPNVKIGEKSLCLNCKNEDVFVGTCPKCNSTNILSGSKYQASLLTSSSLSSVAVADISKASSATVDSAVLAMAKVIVKSTYKVQISTSEVYDSGNKKYWKGQFVITNYSDEEDTFTTDIIDLVEVNDDLETYTKQKIEKILNKENTDNLSITGLFKKELGEFCEELKKYALNPLVSFRDACQSCIDILTMQGVGSDNNTWGTDEEGAEYNLYEKLYVPYYDKLMAIEAEIKIREDEIGIVSGTYDVDSNLIKEGMLQCIEKHREQIQNSLNFENYLGNELWLEFCSYRRESKYSNENYISDGLDNAERFKNALKLFEVAENEIYKASELQHSISTALNNLLAIEKFKPLVNCFNLGNWIRVQIDEEIYKLRLIEYGFNFSDFNNISVDFSDVTKIRNGVTDVKDILNQASSMSSSYSSVKRQASQGEESNTVLTDWINNGLNATNTKIVGAENQSQIWDKNGILCRQYDPITEKYDDEQLKIINSTIAITDNNWKTTKTAIGKYSYVDPMTKELKTAYGVNGETIVGKLIIGEDLIISNNGSNLEFGENGLVVRNDVNTVIINPNETSIFNIKCNGSNIFSLDENGELFITGNITALGESEIDASGVKGLHDVAFTGDYNDLKNSPTLTLSTVATTGSYNDLVDKPTLVKIATTGSYNDLVNKPTLSTVATSGSYNDLVDIEDLKNWVLEQIQSAMNQQS